MRLTMIVPDKTIIVDGEKVNSIENRLVLFDSNIKHIGTTCTDQPGENCTKY